MFDVEGTAPSPQFMQCLQFAGNHLEEEAKRRGGRIWWLKANFEPPFLEHLSFRLGNQLFFIQVADAEGKVTGPGNPNGLQAIADGCDGHACILAMRRSSSGWLPEHDGWGLLGNRTGQPVEPETLVTTEPVEMTDWEVHDFAVQIVRQQLEKDGRQIMSSQGNPGVDPSLWFVGDQGPEWVVVRAARFPEQQAVLPPSWPKIAAQCARLSRRASFASVAVASTDGDKLWRGGPMHVRYEGLVRKS